MRPSILLALPLLAVLALTPAAAEVVNVSDRWCGGDCSEGHNDTACVCTFKGWENPYTSEAWVKCEELPCCDTLAAYCDLGYVNQDQCYPSEVGHGGEAYEPVVCSVMTGHGEKSCEVPCGESGCFAHWHVPHIDEVNEEGPAYCTRSNETCSWWEPWEFPGCLASCDSVEAQSPWDDLGIGLVCG